MKHKVLKPFSKRSENFKKYNEGDSIELNKDEAANLIDHGFVKAAAKKTQPKKDKS